MTSEPTSPRILARKDLPALPVLPVLPALMVLPVTMALTVLPVTMALLVLPVLMALTVLMALPVLLVLLVLLVLMALMVLLVLMRSHRIVWCGSPTTGQAISCCCLRRWHPSLTRQRRIRMWCASRQASTPKRRLSR